MKFITEVTPIKSQIRSILYTVCFYMLLTKRKLKFLILQEKKVKKTILYGHLRIELTILDL